MQTSDVKQTANRRHPRIGILIRPRQQFKYAFILAAGGIVAQSVVIGILATVLRATVTNIIDVQGLTPDVGSAIAHNITVSMTILMLVALTFALVAILIGVRLSHRIYGPLVPMTRHIEHLKNGNYKVRMHLRKNDDMTELKDALNNLAAALESRHSTPGKKAL